MKKLNIICHYMIIVLVVSILVGVSISVLYYKLALTPKYVDTFKDDAKVVSCYIVDKDDSVNGYVSILSYNNQNHILKGKDNYERCVNHIDKYVSCDINKAVYRFGNTEIFITKVNEKPYLKY